MYQGAVSSSDLTPSLERGKTSKYTRREGFCWTQRKLLVLWSVLLLNSAIKLAGCLPHAPTSLPFKGRSCIMHPCFSGFRLGTCHIFKAEEVWVSGLNHLHRNGFLPLVLIKPRVKQPSWPPGPIHVTNYQDTRSQLLIYLRYYVQEVAKALKGSHFLALYFETFSSSYPLCLDLAGLCIKAQNFKESHWLHQKLGIM